MCEYEHAVEAIGDVQSRFVSVGRAGHNVDVHEVVASTAPSLLIECIAIVGGLGENGFVKSALKVGVIAVRGRGRGGIGVFSLHVKFILKNLLLTFMRRPGPLFFRF